ncbi:MAG: hypothetical protein R3Y07_06445 [Eubacteriales bacterium]
MDISSLSNASTYATTTNKTEEATSRRVPKEEGRPAPPPPPPKTDSYTPSSAGLQALATQEDEAAAVTETTQAATSQATEATQDTGNKYEIDRDFITDLKIEQAERQIDFLMQISESFTKQGISMARGDGIWAQIAEGKFEVSEAESAEAAAAISEDGYWGVTQTSERMFEMAMSLSGGDPEVMAEMRECFEKGYEAAEKAWGGELPQISQDTRTATLDLFDKWESENAAQ